MPCCLECSSEVKRKCQKFCSRQCFKTWKSKNWKPAFPPGFHKGSTHTQDTKDKIRASTSDRRGSNNPMYGNPGWRFGKLFTPYGHLVEERLRQLKTSTARRDKEWKLTDDEARELIIADCHYCGMISRVIHESRSNNPAGLHGIDRVDNLQGYVLENVVACCPTCNYAKRSMSRDEFLSWIRRVYAVSCNEGS